LRLRGLPPAIGVLCAALLAAASLVEAHPSKPQRVCHRRHGRRVCTIVRPKPRRHRKTTTSTTTSTSSATTSEQSTSTSETITTQTSTAQTTATQTTTTTTSTTASLPHGTQVEERATGEASPFYALTANEQTFAAGTIHFNVYNTDQDPHTFAIASADGQQLTNAVPVPAGQPSTPVTVTVDLPPGTYTLFCTLPQHAALGMETTIVVK
jgi:plastocyanin